MKHARRLTRPLERRESFYGRFDHSTHHDLNETINPVQATLAWTMGGPKGRRRKEGGFLGAEHILKPDGKLQKVEKKRVGIKGMKAPAREGAEMYDAMGENKIGVVTSGTFSPCLKGMCILIFVCLLSLPGICF